MAMLKVNFLDLWTTTSVPQQGRRPGNHLSGLRAEWHIVLLPSSMLNV